MYYHSYILDSTGIQLFHDFWTKVWKYPQVNHFLYAKSIWIIVAIGTVQKFMNPPDTATSLNKKKDVVNHRSVGIP